MCHLVLINRSLGLESGHQEAEERILEQYTRHLMHTEKLGKCYRVSDVRLFIGKYPRSVVTVPIWGKM
jgi:Uma2 family endonuclease